VGLQRVPQAPQLPALAARTAQVPPQLVLPGGQVAVQALFTQTWLFGQSWKHAPQWLAFDWVFWHARPHWVSPAGQEATHAPLTQTWVGAHAVLQSPQWFAFAERSVHWPPQLVEAGQIAVQAPFAHAVPLMHTLPAVPQLLESEPRPTQPGVSPSLV
jgi:hypothetical protein